MITPDQQSKEGIISIGLSDCVVCFFQDGKHAGDGDTISLFVFDENEHELAQEASQNNGVVDYHKVAHHHYPDLQLSKAKTDSVIEEKDGSQGDQDSFGSVDLEPYMNADPEDSADRSKRFRQNGNRTGHLSDINTKREVIKPARNAVSEYSVSPYSCPLRVCLSPLASLISLNFFPDFSNFI